MVTQELNTYMDQHREEAFALLLELAQIPAPSNQEQKRAEFCREWLARQGAEGVYIDEALNVVYPVGCEEGKEIVVFAAHSDVVFPDTEQLPLEMEDGRIYCPGVGDDTANVVALLMTAKLIAEHKLCPDGVGVMLVVDAGEEGLGNLKGIRHLMSQYGSRIREFIALDGQQRAGVNRAVGSRRYRIWVETEGGHSYGNFGNRNAIACLAAVIDDLYRAEVPALGKTTYNVGTVKGGTSVNTIAQYAEMLYEFRSDEREAMEIMQRYLDRVLETHRADGVSIGISLVGERPCGGDVNPVSQEKLEERVRQASLRCYGLDLTFGPGSTDCNIPLSMGIPAVCVGCYQGHGAHTRQEYVEIDSLLPGLYYARDLVLGYF